MTQASSILKKGTFWSSAILIAVLIFQIITHLGWLQLSTEAGHLAIPWMVNRGTTLYNHITEIRPPLTTLMTVVALKLFPAEPALTVRMLNLLLILLISVLVYVTTYRLSGGNRMAAIFALLFWAWWEPVYVRIFVYFETVMGLTIVAGVLLWLLTENRNPRWLAPMLTGLTLGLSTEAKQQAWAVVAMFGLWLLLFRPRDRKLKDLIAFGLGALLIPALTLGIFFVLGNWKEYIYWNWAYLFSGLVPGIPFTGDYLRKLLLMNILLPVFGLLAWRQKEARPYWVLLGLMWIGTSANLLPRMGENHVPPQMMFVSIMSGLVLAPLAAYLPKRPLRSWLSEAPVQDLVIVGVAIAIIAGWIWTEAAAYGTTPLGRAGIVAYDELRPVANFIRGVAKPGETLYVLPETDSSAQLHVLSDMQVPDTWAWGDFWILQAPGVTEGLLREWSTKAPDYIVYFPDLALEQEPSINPLVDFMKAHYEQVGQVDSVILHGNALVYHLVHQS